MVLCSVSVLVFAVMVGGSDGGDRAARDLGQVGLPLQVRWAAAKRWRRAHRNSGACPEAEGGGAEPPPPLIKVVYH